MVKLFLISMLFNNHFFSLRDFLRHFEQNLISANNFPHYNIKFCFQTQKIYVAKKYLKNYVTAFEFLDIRKNISELSTIVYQIKGLLNGKTLLPFPEVLVFLNSLLHLFFDKEYLRILGVSKWRS